MAGSTNQLGIAVVGKDQITPVLAKIERSVGHLDKAFGSLGARIKTGIQWHVINNGLNMLDRAFRRLADAIPDLIRRGEQWASVVDSIGDATGMTARQASELAAVQKLVGGSTDSLGKAMVQLAKNAIGNEKAFKDLGIATRDGNGHMLDAYELFQSVRQRVAGTGASLLSTAAAAKVFGRGAGDLLDVLTLSNRQWRLYAEQARRSGLILTEAGAKAAEQWSRTKNLLDSAITGIGAQILQGIAPTLIGLSNAVTKVLQDNMSNIVRFVSGAIQAVASMVGQFLGVDLDINLIDQIDKAGGGAGGGKLGRGLKAQSDGARDAAKAYKGMASAARELREAQRALDSARGESIFGGDMSRADLILAKQARAAAIKDAEERVSDARRTLHQHQRTMHAIAAQTGQTIGEIRRKWKAESGKNSPIIKGLEDTLADAKAFGKGIALAIQEAFFGKATLEMQGGVVVSVRHGGLVGALQGVQTWLQKAVGGLEGLVGHLQNLEKLLGGGGGQGEKLGPALVEVSAAALIARFFGGRGGGGTTPGAPGTPGTPSTKPMLPSGGLSWLALSMFGAQPDSMGNDDPRVQSLFRSRGYVFRDGQWVKPGLGGGQRASGSFASPTEEETRQISIAAWRAIRSRNPFNFDGSSGSVFGGLGGGLSSGGSFGVDTGTDAQMRHLADVFGWPSIDRNLSESGPLATGLANIESAVAGLAAALTGDGGGNGGGDGKPPPSGGNANSIKGLRIRMKAAETVNRIQGRALTVHAGLIGATASVNIAQTSNIQNHARRLTQHDRNIDVIYDQMRSHGWIANTPHLAGARRGGGATVRLVLDAKETRRLFTRGVATTTLRPDN